MEKIEVVMTKAKETKGTYVYEEELGAGGKPPMLKNQYIQKWGSHPVFVVVLPGKACLTLG